MKKYANINRPCLISVLRVDFMGLPEDFRVGRTFTIYNCSNKDVNTAFHLDYPRVVTVRFYLNSPKRGVVPLSEETVTYEFD